MLLSNQTFLVGAVKVDIKDVQIGTYWWFCPSAIPSQYFKVSSIYSPGTDKAKVKLRYLWSRDEALSNMSGYETEMTCINSWWHTALGPGCIQSGVTYPPGSKPGTGFTVWNLNDKVYEVETGTTWEGRSDIGDDLVKVDGFKHDTCPTMFDTIVCDRQRGKYNIVEHRWDYFLTEFKLFNQPMDVGTICISCNRDYPYADAAVNFECWGCRNGA